MSYWPLPPPPPPASVTGTVTAGTLSIDTAATPTFGVTLDGIDQVATYTVPTTVTDATGTDSGWNLTVSSTQFTTGALTLSTGASSVTGIASSCDGGSTCTDPSNAVTYPLAIPAAAPAVKYFNADATTGAGMFTNTPTIAVAAPCQHARRRLLEHAHAGRGQRSLSLPHQSR